LLNRYEKENIILKGISLELVRFIFSRETTKLEKLVKEDFSDIPEEYTTSSPETKRAL